MEQATAWREAIGNVYGQGLLHMHLCVLSEIRRPTF